MVEIETGHAFYFLLFLDRPWHGRKVTIRHWSVTWAKCLIQCVIRFWVENSHWLVPYDCLLKLCSTESSFSWLHFNPWFYNKMFVLILLVKSDWMIPREWHAILGSTFSRFLSWSLIDSWLYEIISSFLVCLIWNR